eukprot:Skav221778  [mRNA]  locus=scaffold2426:253243:253974:+ [translate_table: standard]
MTETPSSEAVVTLHVLTPSGQSVSVSASQSDTVLMLKKRLQSSEVFPENFRCAPSHALRLIFGTEALCDDARLSEKGLGDGDQLSVIVSHALQGNYVASFPFSNDGPCGSGTLADIKADFGHDGTFNITMRESLLLWEIIRFDVDEDYDEYAAGEAWDHHYQGTVHMDGSSEFRMIITSLNRKGIFQDEVCPGTELLGKLGDRWTEVSVVSIRLPFAASREELGVMLWVSLDPACGSPWGRSG